jgi:hypothetical protein
VAHDGRGARQWPLLARTAEGALERLGDVAYDPAAGRTGLGAFVRRLQLQVAIGQPF